MPLMSFCGVCAALNADPRRSLRGKARTGLRHGAFLIRSAREQRNCRPIDTVTAARYPAFIRPLFGLFAQVRHWHIAESRAQQVIDQTAGAVLRRSEPA